MHLAVVGIVKWLKTFVTIGLMFSYVVKKSRNQRLIVTLGSSICICMIGRSGQCFHPQEGAHCREELGNKFWSVICKYIL